MQTSPRALTGAARVIAHIHLIDPDGVLEVAHDSDRTYAAVLYRGGVLRAREQLDAADRDSAYNAALALAPENAHNYPHRQRPSPAPPPHRVAADELEEVVSGNCDACGHQGELTCSTYNDGGSEHNVRTYRFCRDSEACVNRRRDSARRHTANPVLITSEGVRSDDHPF